MISHAICSIKMNLTLRVLGRRADGMHDLFTVFLRLPSPESIAVDTSADDDLVECVGASVAGENIVSRAIAYVREHARARAPLGVRASVYKQLPQGSGVGAGSGNAAALLSIFRSELGDGRDPMRIASLGADVSFLASDMDIAIARGRGDELEPCGAPPDLVAAIFFPEWSSGTADAYRELDATDRRPLSDKEARSEAESFVGALRRGERAGLIPNDFELCMPDRRPARELAYEMMEGSGALAWGLCGSGSACAALFAPEMSSSARALADDIAARRPLGRTQALIVRTTGLGLVR